MSTTGHLPQDASANGNDTKWKRRRDIPLAILAWIGVVAVVLWGASHVIRALLLLIIAALLSYALTPGVKWLQRFIPRPLAIVSICLITLACLSLLFYFVTITALHQFTSLARSLAFVLAPRRGTPSPLENFLHSIGITQQQIAAARQQLIARGESLASSALPLITSILDVLLDTVVVAVITIYFLIDGHRLNNWCRHNLPDKMRPDFLIDTLQRVVGGYIRGQVLLATLIGLLVGIGMALFRVPYALLLGVLAFILEFIPILGTLISGAICTLIALTQGIWIAVGVLIYFILVHILEGDIVGPRVVGEAIGLHPIVSISAVIAGSQIFGIWGALLASPIAGVLQALLVTFWLEWRHTHPEQFGRRHRMSTPEANGSHNNGSS